MNIAYLLIGGNLGNRFANLQKAIQLIEQNCGQVVQSSAIYETEAWGITDQPAFYNQFLKISFFEEFLPILKSILPGFF